MCLLSSEVVYIIALIHSFLPDTGLCGNPTVCQLKGCLEIRLYASYGVVGKLSCPSATGLRRNPAVCRLLGHVKTWLYASYGVTCRPGCLPATGARRNLALCWLFGHMETPNCTGYGVALKSGPGWPEILAVGLFIKFLSKIGT